MDGEGLIGLALGAAVVGKALESMEHGHHEHHKKHFEHDLRSKIFSGRD